MLVRCLVILSLAACRYGFDERVLPPGDAPDAPPDGPPLATCASRVAAPVPTSGRVSGTLAAGSTDHGSCGGAEASEDLYALDVRVPGSRIQVAADATAQDATPSIHIRTACDDPASEVECDTTDGIGDRPQITRAVDVGRYFVFVDGQDGRSVGDYEATLTVLLPKGATCDPANARDRCDGSLECVAGTCQPATCAGAMALDGPGPHVLTVTTQGQPNRHAGTCGDGGDGGLRAPELVITLTLAAASSGIVVDTDFPGTDHDTLVYVRDACNGAELACDDDTGQDLHAIATTGPVPAGTYVIFIDGFSTHVGTTELTITAN